MNIGYNRWKSLFLFSLGLSLGAAFCMKWMESDLMVNNEQFTILGLELFYSNEKMENLLASLDSRVRMILQYHLYFDFAFMAGIYPAIAAFCMMSRKNQASQSVRKLLSALALLQLIAWIADIIENYYLLVWMPDPSIGSEFIWYHFIVAVKWIIALLAVMTAVAFLLWKMIKKTNGQA